MKKAIIFSTLLLMCSCIGKMEDLSLSTDSVIFTAEESSYVVTSEVELEIEIVNENNSSQDIPFSDSSHPKYEGSWMTATNYGTAILIEVSENNSEENRYASISLRNKTNPNTAGVINITQLNKQYDKEGFE